MAALLHFIASSRVEEDMVLFKETMMRGARTPTEERRELESDMFYGVVQCLKRLRRKYDEKTFSLYSKPRHRNAWHLGHKDSGKIDSGYSERVGLVMSTRMECTGAQLSEVTPASVCAGKSTSPERRAMAHQAVPADMEELGTTEDSDWEMLDSPDLPQLSEEKPAPTLHNGRELPEAGEVDEGEETEVGEDFESGEEVETP